MHRGSVLAITDKVKFLRQRIWMMSTNYTLVDMVFRKDGRKEDVRKLIEAQCGNA